ncbi:MAG: Cell division ATP-binding protein FtsE [Myxococcota bacterium]|nr:Cell division ATP-binding protein FtsE [Myxococcota bacterium]
MIEVQSLTRAFAGSPPVLNNISFRVERGEFVFLTGPSGAGKTTLFRILIGMDQPNSGTVRVADQPVTQFTRHQLALARRSIGVVFQDFKLLPNRTVAENVSLPLEVLGKPPAQIRARVFKVLTRVGMPHRQQAYPRQLSGGEQQRVAIARALVHDPQVLLADEPTGNLDTERSFSILELLREANARGATVVVATHSAELIEKYHSRVLVLGDGGIRDAGSGGSV